MVKELSVRFRGVEVGILRLVKGKMEFTYNDETAQPISLSMPIQKEPYKEKMCRAFFGGLLPENPNMRSLLAKKYNINENDDFKLLEAIGRDCAGALSFHHIDEEFDESDLYEIKGSILTDEELKQHIEELPYRPYLGKRLSLAGAQEKTAICLINNQIALPNENVPTTHILKTALPKYIQSIENEYICMKAAKQIGIRAAEVDIRKVDDLEFLLITRFDRQPYFTALENNDFTLHMTRRLQEDFAQALGVQSRDKYKVSVKDCLQVLNFTKEPALSKAEFTKRIIFNYLIGNTDAHAKNFSILWLFSDYIELSPAYDILCSTIYDCDQRIAMKIGKARFYNEVTEKDWELFAHDLDISYKFVKTELQRQKKLLPQIIQQICDELNCEVGRLIYNDVLKRCS